MPRCFLLGLELLNVINFCNKKEEIRPIQKLIATEAKLLSPSFFNENNTPISMTYEPPPTNRYRIAVLLIFFMKESGLVDIYRSLPVDNEKWSLLSLYMNMRKIY